MGEERKGYGGGRERRSFSISETSWKRTRDAVMAVTTTGGSDEKMAPFTSACAAKERPLRLAMRAEAVDGGWGQSQLGSVSDKQSMFGFSFKSPQLDTDLMEKCLVPAGG